MHVSSSTNSNRLYTTTFVFIFRVHKLQTLARLPLLAFRLKTQAKKFDPGPLNGGSTLKSLPDKMNNLRFFLLLL